MLVKTSPFEQSRLVVVIIMDTSIYEKQLYRAMHPTDTLTFQKAHPMRLRVDEEILYRQDPITSAA
jgi:hypothetical protein